MIIVEPLEKKHVPFVVQLEEYCFSDSWSAAGVEAELKNPCARFLVARDGEMIAGYLSAAFIMDEGSVNRVAVAGAYRRRGIGTLLMRHLLEQAWEQGIAFVTLEVRRSNEKAIAFYKKMGFCSVGERRNFYLHPKEDAVLMTVKRGDIG